METIRFPVEVVEKAIGALADGKDKTALQQMRQRTALRRYADLTVADLTRKQVRALHKVCSELKGHAKFKEEIEFLVNANLDPSNIKVKSVRDLVTAFRKYLADGIIKGYIFKRGEYGALTPYLPVQITYTAPSKYNHESVTLRLCHLEVDGKEKGRNVSISEYHLIECYKQIDREAAERAQRKREEELAEADEEDEDEEDESRTARAKRIRANFALDEGVPIDRLLTYLGYYKETKELHASYNKQFDRFIKYVTMYGKQFKVRGQSSTASYSYWSYYNGSSMLVDGRPSRAIMDTRPFEDQDEESSGKRRLSKRRDEDEEQEIAVDDVDARSLTKGDFTLGKAANEVTFYSGTNIESFDIPMHLELKIFHLEKHDFYNLHVQNMVPYKYRTDLKDSLILPDEIIEIAELLAGTEDEEAEDVIEGKSQGTLVACIGDPGLGKTLLAEVISEQVQKPLYKIQAAQLGLEPEDMEKQLRMLLHRAERWDAVLMIDEANAYIHDRGVDVKQNAIVGVFLRLLEYYRGIMFLTTNQTGPDGLKIDIDDAILSRCNAVVTFDLPTKEDAVKLWKLQAKLLKIKISDDFPKKAAEMFNYSGRTIRQIMRLAGRLARKRGVEVTLDMLETVDKHISKTRREGLRKKD